jgi:hypothetical protein
MRGGLILSGFVLIFLISLIVGVYALSDFYFESISSVDVDDNGIINIMDMSLVKRCLFSSISGSCAHMDINKDDIIDYNDLHVVKALLFSRFVECSETDGGLNVSVSGSLNEIWSDRSGFVTHSVSDVCSGGFLKEWYCDEGYPKLREVSCGEGNVCVNGACVGIGLP